MAQLNMVHGLHRVVPLEGMWEGFFFLVKITKNNWRKGRHGGKRLN